MSEVRAGSSEVRVTATDELRRLLDERGVEWTGGHYTDWDDANGHPAEAFEFDGTLYVSCVLTPAQAVEATLGSDLQAENAKLRELLSELYESAWLEYPSAFEHTFGVLLRKLGIEVDA